MLPAACRGRGLTLLLQQRASCRGSTSRDSSQTALSALLISQVRVHLHCMKLTACVSCVLWNAAADFNYNQTLPKASLRLPGRVHQGFALISASIWPALRSAFDSLLPGSGSGTHPYYRHNKPPRGIRNIYISGHSLGAGVATLISYTMQVRYHSEKRLPQDGRCVAAPVAPIAPCLPTCLGQHHMSATQVS